MAATQEPAVLRLVVSFLRTYGGLTQAELARASRISQGTISLYESGQKIPSEASLRRLAAAVSVPWPVVSHLRRFYAVVITAAQRSTSEPDAVPIESAILEPVLLALSPHLLDRAEPQRDLGSSAEARREAEAIWTMLGKLPARRRRRLVELSPWLSWALAELVCHESEAVAAHKTEDALDLAELALLVAERVPGEEAWRSRVLGYCWAFVGNARRVANNHAGADEAFARAWGLWRIGSPGAPDSLQEWRLLDLEASLRREQHRFPEALILLDRARASVSGNSVAFARILLKRATVFHQSGDAEGALRALAEAAPFVEASGDARQKFTLGFNVADNLCHVGRFQEAAERLPEVRELAVQQGNELDFLRVTWLEARVAAGRGRKAEAMEGLERVQREFAARKLPYDAALASLELAELCLEAGRTQEVRELASAMAWIFHANGIGREAMAALRLFTNAAHREVATVELARRAIAEVKAARQPA